jgi:ribosomal protein S18 acetylase RimI-like enzyme
MTRAMTRAATEGLLGEVIRRADVDDAEALCAIGAATFREAFGHLYPPADLETYLGEAYALESTRGQLADPRYAFWLIETAGAAIGYAQVGPCALPHPDVGPQGGELKRIYLRQGWQGGGRGSRLLSTALDWLAAEGFDPLWIGVWSQNLGAQRLYRRLGFEKVGEYHFKVGQTRDHEFILRR